MTEVEKPPPADRYAIIDFFGHKKLAGRVSEVEAFGGKMGRLDVLAADGAVSHTRFFTPAAVYGLVYVTEAAARVAAAGCDAPPVKSWDLPEKVKAAIRAADREVRPALPAADDGGPHAVREDDASDLLF